MVRWLVTGARGMLGSDLSVVLADHGEEVTAAGRAELDVTDPAAVSGSVQGHDVVVNCAAWTDVDGAEADEGAAHALNAEAPRLVARACAEQGAVLVHVSTDYVFDGKASESYPEDHPLAPLNAYGRTKAAGERAVRDELPGGHLVVRTAWLYGAHGPCFPRTMARLAAHRDILQVVDDQVGQPTWTRDVATLVVALVRRQVRGTVHATAGGSTTWFGFAREVVVATGRDPGMVVPVDSSAFPRPATRPAFSVLGRDRLVSAGVQPIGPWDERWRAASETVLNRQPEP